tara:strand:+ start:625 stop:816 length:192 start_codon:yes stop_codon:yes gene_type:complete
MLIQCIEQFYFILRLPSRQQQQRLYSPVLSDIVGGFDVFGFSALGLNYFFSIIGAGMEGWMDE